MKKLIQQLLVVTITLHTLPCFSGDQAASNAVLREAFLARHPTPTTPQVPPPPSDETAEAPTCPICYEAILQIEDILELTHSGSAVPHLSHRHCSMEWFQNGRHTCPSCRAPLTQEQKQALGLVAMPLVGLAADQRGEFIRSCEENNLHRVQELLALTPALVNTEILEMMSLTTILAYAIKIRRFALARLLINRGANVNQAPASWTALDYACRNNAPADLYTLLLNRGANPNRVENYSNTTPLEIICSKLDHEYALGIAALMINRPGTNINSVGTQSPLSAACEAGNIPLIRFLLERGANPLQEDRIDHYGWQNSAWDVAKATGNKTIKRMFIQHTETPLHRACREGNLPEVTRLLDNGADFNATTIEGSTPMWYACRNGQSRIAELLKTRGASQSWKEYLLLQAVKHGPKVAAAGILAATTAGAVMHMQNQD